MELNSIIMTSEEGFEFEVRPCLCSITQFSEENLVLGSVLQSESSLMFISADHLWMITESCLQYDDAGTQILRAKGQLWHLGDICSEMTYW